MFYKISILILIQLFTCSVGNISSQNDPFTLKGRIVDELGVPISDVSIIEINNAKANTITNTVGSFSMTLSPNDYYYLAITHINYETKKLKVKKGDNNLVIKMILRYSDIPEITIDGKAFNTVREKLDFLNQQNRNPSLNNSIESLLVTMGGVNSNNELSNQYNVRGGNYDENVIYVNGIEVRKPLLIRNAQQEGLSFINPLMINKIDFSRGGFTSEYGDRMSSVLDIGYKKPINNFEGSANGSFTGGGIYIGSSSNFFSSVNSFRYKTTNRVLNTSDVKGEYKPQFSNFQTFMTFTLSDNLNLFLIGNYDNNTFEMFPKDRETKFGSMFDPKTYHVSYQGKEDDNYATFQGSVGINYIPLDNLDITFSSTFFDSKESEKLDLLSNYELTNTSGSASTSTSRGSYQEYFRNRLRSNISSYKYSSNLYLGKHQFQWGAQLDHENVRDHIQEWNRTNNLLNNEQLILNNAIYSQNKLKTDRYTGFIQDTYRYQTDNGANWTFNAGARFTHWQFNNENLISPRATIAYIPTNNNWVFRFSSGIYYQSPFYKETKQLYLVENGLHAYALNQNVKSQKSIHFIFGNDYYFKSGENKLRLTSEFYYKKLSDINPYTVDNQKITYLGENIGKGYIAGADFRLYGEFIKDVDSWVSLSLMKTSQKLNGVKRPISSDQRYNISFFLQDYMPGYERLAVSIKGVFADGLPFYNAPLDFSSDYLRLPTYKRIDLGFNWQLLGEDFPIRNRSNFLSSMKNISIGLDIFNILDIKNTNNYYWITDNSDIQYAVPNYLTGRMINLKFEISF